MATLAPRPAPRPDPDRPDTDAAARTPPLDDPSRLSVMMDMLRAVSRESDPNRANFQFASRYWRINPFDYYISTSIRGLAPGRYKITRSVPLEVIRTATMEQALARNPWRDWESLPEHSGGFLGRVMERPEPQLFHNLHLRGDPVLGDTVADMGSCLAVPLFDGGEALNWSFTFRRDPQGFRDEDVPQTMLVSNLVGATIKNLVSFDQIRRLNDRLTAQFEDVARVQQQLLPAVHPPVPGLKIATSYLPSDIAGGDYYDFFELTGGRWGFLIADASGHGVGAATVMAMLHAILHSYPHLDRGPAAVLQWANEKLAAARMDGSFVTAVFAIYDPATRRLSYARAGHPPPLIKDGRNGSVYPLEGAASLPLGIESPYDAAEASVTLRPKDSMVLYTDGITEAFAPDRKTMFGVAGLEAALERCTGDPDCVMDTIHAALFAHTGVQTRADDQTLVAFRVES